VTVFENASVRVQVDPELQTESNDPLLFITVRLAAKETLLSLTLLCICDVTVCTDIYIICYLRDINVLCRQRCVLTYAAISVVTFTQTRRIQKFTHFVCLRLRMSFGKVICIEVLPQSTGLSEVCVCVCVCGGHTSVQSHE
jgi:hypothetical protein